MTLTTGNQYDIDTLALIGWSGDSDGCNAADYFTAAGVYKGADCDGVEPIFDNCSAVLTADQIETAREIGNAWGKQEFSLYCDEHNIPVCDVCNACATVWYSSHIAGDGNAGNWGSDDTQAFCDAHDLDLEKKAEFEESGKQDLKEIPEWTNGQYCGDLSEFRPSGMDDQDEAWYAIRDAVETVIDNAAKAAWDAAKEARK